VTRELPLWPPLLAMAALLVWWNQLPLHDHSLHTREHDLSFVPDPPLGRMLCIGQCGAASKLQWIDSFSYISLQFDKRDDTLMGSHQSGFKRLYDQLIGEDPYFLPFYEYGAFSLGGVLNRHDLALGLQLRGIEQMPNDPWLRQQAAAELYTSFSLEDHHPDQMDSFLNDWADHMSDMKLKRQVWDWMAAMARRHHIGTAQLGYWEEQLALFPPSSSEGKYVVEAMREELAHASIQDLEWLAAAYEKRRLTPALTLADCLDPALVAERYPHGLPETAPIQLLGGHLALRTDPFGYPFHLRDGEVISPGMDRQVLKNLAAQRHAAAVRAASAAPIKDITELGRHIDLPWVPPEGHWTYQDGDLELQWDDPPAAPWPLHAAGAPGSGAPRS
jgi:hypothetical protein